MWDYQDSIETPAPREQVWERYRDVSSWPQWQPGVARAELDGPFAAGTTGVITSAEQGPAPFTLTKVVDGVGFVQETPLDESVVLRSHFTIEPVPDGGTRIVHRTELAGPSSDEYAAAISGMLAASLTAGLAGLGEVLAAS